MRSNPDSSATPPSPSAPTLPVGTKHTGVCPPARGYVLAHIIRHAPVGVPVWLIVAPDAKTAAQLAEDTPFFLTLSLSSTAKHPAFQSLLFPESAPATREMADAFAASADRHAVLSALRAVRNQRPEARSQRPESKKHPAAEARPLASGLWPLCIITTPTALLQPVPALEEYAAREITLTRGQTIGFQTLLDQLRALDYDSEAVCEAPGHYATRGGIIDVYPVTATQPCRLDFFGDEIEEIRTYDPVTQRSDATLEQITIAASPPASNSPPRAPALPPILTPPPNSSSSNPPPSKPPSPPSLTTNPRPPQPPPLPLLRRPPRHL
ncbi:hypothetical protein Ga0100231_017510 [Opitutaceae bacterium TAV4]|nr:hypothetical protein Ga0100231_017510 [Opitutaceae bacterium TAV4]